MANSIPDFQSFLMSSARANSNMLIERISVPFKRVKNSATYGVRTNKEGSMGSISRTFAKYSVDASRKSIENMKNDGIVQFPSTTKGIMIMLSRGALRLSK